MSQVLANPTNIQRVKQVKKISTKKQVKRKIMLPPIYKVGFVFLCISLMTWLASSLFLKSYNINLSMEQQEIQSKISSLQVENDAMKVEIQALNSRERVTNIAQDAGLETNQNNIVTVDGQ